MSAPDTSTANAERLARRLADSVPWRIITDEAAEVLPALAAERDAAVEHAEICQELTDAARAEVAAARAEAEAERDEFFNMLGRITEELDLPVDVTAGRIIEAIRAMVDDEREACASVEVRVTVPNGAETWTPLEAWEEGLAAFDAAFRAAIRARGVA